MDIIVIIMVFLIMLDVSDILKKVKQNNSILRDLRENESYKLNKNHQKIIKMLEKQEKNNE